MNIAQFIHGFISLLIITNPLVVLPAVITITSQQKASEKRATAITATLSIAAILVMMTWLGSLLLKILGIHFGVFQTAGGALVIILALSMINAQDNAFKTTATEQKSVESGAIIPISFPLIAGPGAISAVIVNATNFPGIPNHLLLTLACIMVALWAGICIYFANTLEKFLGVIGLNMFRRFGGLILLAVGIQIFSEGLKTFFLAAPLKS